MISKIGRQLLAGPITAIIIRLQGTGITPNNLTSLGFFLTAISATLLLMGQLRWGGLLLIIAALFDMLDGSLARQTNQISSFGAFWDSTLDRYSESLTLLALVYYYVTVMGATQGQRGGTEIVLLAVTLIGSFMVSYTRARAEALNFECKTGVLQRPERVILLIVGLLFGWMQPVLWILAIFTNVTAIQRMVEVYTQAQARATR
ncbi:MAG: CDP-alcohol phosphatidyltransferase family protein [Caldilineaceae bacterium]|nr:CDP-alcohol phosphatidyltransferase family protein [Caldilineaceae bacterium]MBP8108336.1 CDP-alcohol phosphatidyltransferase family protein [Caldilineaceae bacterium]MBP8122526.1 CDP-alcohol phosphatidyltransferase family protein [Caldilineaceae bacterium]MBP9072979.1 CDP-alcohol phosphatidyltransferase family protein [Caldilineaceae bacterium]